MTYVDSVSVIMLKIIHVATTVTWTDTRTEAQSTSDPSEPFKNTDESHGDCDVATTSGQPGLDGEGQSSGTLDPCGCPCCTISGPPNQPADVRDSKQTYSHHIEELKRTKSYSRSLQTSWYKKYPWISVCTTRFFTFTPRKLTSEISKLLQRNLFL